MWHSICYVHYGYYIQRDQSALYTNFGTICTMATLERPKCTLHQFWHNVHYGYTRETKVHFTPILAHLHLCQLWHILVYSNCGTFVFVPIMAYSCLYLCQLWHFCVCTNYGTFAFMPIVAHSCLFQLWHICVCANNGISVLIFMPITAHSCFCQLWNIHVLPIVAHSCVGTFVFVPIMAQLCLYQFWHIDDSVLNLVTTCLH